VPGQYLRLVFRLLIDCYEVIKTLSISFILLYWAYNRALTRGFLTLVQVYFFLPDGNIGADPIQSTRPRPRRDGKVFAVQCTGSGRRSTGDENANNNGLAGRPVGQDSGTHCRFGFNATLWDSHKKRDHHN
jgi:hypothetical protein